MSPTAHTIVIKYDGADITALCSIAETKFTNMSGTTPGDCHIVFRDVRQRHRFVTGKPLELWINGSRSWDGYFVTAGYNYWFETHTANCEPCPHVTPRKLILKGAERSVLFTRRVLYNKASPADASKLVWPAGTTDQEVLLDSMSLYLDDVDGIDLTTNVEAVGSPDPYVDFRVPGATSYWGELMRETAQSVGAVFYIDPDRSLVYTDVNSPDAPFGISDDPGAGEIGCRELEIMFDASQMVNDAMIWGAGQGKDHITFRRVTDAASVAAHGRWQNEGGYHTNLYQGDSVQRAAESIVYGSPSSRRGHKDDQVSVRCTIYEPGFRVAQKVEFRSAVWGFSDVIPIRQMTISFISPTHARFDLVLSHELDEPWMTSEFWWPERDPQPPDRRTTSCTVYGETDGGPKVAGSLNGSTDANHMGSHRVAHHWLDWFVTIDNGNVWVWYDSRPNKEVFTTGVGNTSAFFYTHGWADKMMYTGLLSFFAFAFRELGQKVLGMDQYFIVRKTPVNTANPGSRFKVHVEGNLSMNGSYQLERLRVGHPSYPLENLPVKLGILEPRKWPFDLQEVGSVLWEGSMDSGDSIPVTLDFRWPDDTPWSLNVACQEIPAPVSGAEILFSPSKIEYTPLKPQAVGVGDDDGGFPCVETLIYGSTCMDATRKFPFLDRFKVPVAYVRGSTKVYLNGIHQIAGIDYVEHDPANGVIRFLVPAPGSVTMCFDAAGSWGALPDLGQAFIAPTSGPISGTFGSQQSLWPGMYWHGSYYDHFHNGVDFNVDTGTPVVAAHDGVVSYEDQAAGGTMIHLGHELGLRTVYAHLSSRVAAAGALVRQGDLIAYSGASGNVTGPHLHWGLVWNGTPENPLPFTVL